MQNQGIRQDFELMKKAFRDLGSGFKKIATEDQFPEIKVLHYLTGSIIKV